MGKNDKFLKITLYAILIVLLNLVAFKWFFRVDLTKNKLYSLSQESKEVVKSLKEPLTIKVFFTKNLPAPANVIEVYLKDLLQEYANYGGDFFNYKFYNVTPDEGDLSTKAKENRELAAEYGIMPQKVQKVEQDEVKFQSAYMGLVMIHGDLTETIQAITSTDKLEYTLTTTIKKLNNKVSALLNLPQEIKVKFICDKKLEVILPQMGINSYKDIENRVKKVLDKLNKKNYGRLSYEFVDESKLLVEKVKELKNYNLNWNAFKTAEGKDISKGEGVLALMISVEDKNFIKQLLEPKMVLGKSGIEQKFEIIPDSETEAFINGNIDKLIDINEKIGYLSSHRTQALASQLPPQLRMNYNVPALNNFSYLLEKNYSLNSIDLNNGKSIPDDIKTLIIVGPKEKFNDWELWQLDQFLMKGNSLVFFMDSFKEVKQNQRQFMQQFNQQPVYVPLDTGLDKLLKHYGVEIEKSYVMDKNCYKNSDQFNGEMSLYFAPLIKNENINKDLTVMKEIKGLVTLKSSPVYFKKRKDMNVKGYTLFSSSNFSWEVKDKITLNPMLINIPSNEKEMKSYPLAVLLEGDFRSYFIGKKVPQKPLKDEREKEQKDKNKKYENVKLLPSKIKNQVVKLDNSTKKGRIFVMGSSDILKDNILDKDGVSSNSVFIANIIDYLGNNSNMALLRGKTQGFNPIRDTKPLERLILKIFNIGVLPLLIIILGFVVLVRRKLRRKRIEEKFSIKDKGDK